MKNRISLLFAFSFITLLSYGEKIQTVSTYSASMQKEIPAIVVTPDNYSAKKSYPVVYLLHGFGGSYASDWASKAWETTHLADTYDLIFVIPDGEKSWYFDSPVDPSYWYETYITQELISYVDKNYSTIASREGRAITGLSMGGHGALYLAFRHQDIYSAAGSTSGGVDFRPFPNNWDIAKRLGSYAEYPENWEKNTVINLTHLLTPNSLALIFDCGTEDFFYEMNCRLHEKLLYNNIPHDFISRPGAHNHEYWKNSIQYHVLFFNKHFKSKKEGNK